MSVVSYFVRYDIAVADLKGFLERYRKVHVPGVTEEHLQESASFGKAGSSPAAHQ